MSNEKNEILKKLEMVLAALNNITVCGKQNLANLSGSIAILEEIGGVINNCDIAMNIEKTNHSAKNE